MDAYGVALPVVQTGLPQFIQVFGSESDNTMDAGFAVRSWSGILWGKGYDAE